MCVKTKKKKDEGWQVETSPQTVGAAVWDSIFYLAKPIGFKPKMKKTLFDTITSFSV